MKIIQLEPRPRKYGTGGVLVEVYLLDAISKTFGTEIERISDAELGATNKIRKLFSYWKVMNRIAKADMVIGNTSNRRLCFFLKALKRKKKDIFILVLHHHFEAFSYAEHTFQRFLHGFWENNILKSADCVLTFGEYTHDVMKKKFPEIREKCLGVPIDKKGYSHSVRKPGELLYIGTIEERKGIDYLVEAASKLQDLTFHVTLVGDYSRNKAYYESLIDKVKRYHLEEKISFVGRVSQEEKNRFLQEASIFVFPTTNEGYGIVIVEAMGHGIPVVAFDNSSIPYLVKDQYNGLLVKNLDAGDLSEKMRYMLSNYEKVQAMGENALNTFQEALDDEKFVKNAREFFEDLKKSRFS